MARAGRYLYGRSEAPVRKIPKIIYQTADQIDARIREREVDAAKLPQGDQRQAILKEIAQLRMYAEAKRWTELPALKSLT
jgi:hypothetical protein